MKAILIRHCTSSHQAADAPLAADGYRQAEDLVPVLADLRAGPLYTSPYTRAQETIAPYARASGQVVTTLDELRERLLSPEKLPDWQDHIRRSFEDTQYAPEGGESHTRLRTRAARALTRMAEAGGALPAFVTHGGLTSALFNACDPAFGFDDWQSLRNPDLFEVNIRDGQIQAFRRIELEMHV